MADNLAVTAGTGSTIGMDEVVDGTLGTVKVGFGKIMDGTLDSTNKLIVNSSGEALTHPTANSQVDMNKVAGTVVDTNSGVKSAGTQRVVLATDQPALTNALKVDGSAVTQPVSLASTTVTGTVTVDTELPAAAALADSTANPTVPGVGAFNEVYATTAATWGRQRSIEHGQNTTGAGVTAAGLLAEFDDTSPTAVTENQFAPVRMSSRREVYTTLRDAAGNERGANVTAGNALVVDGSAVTQPVSLTSTTVTGTVAVTESGTWNVGASTATGSAVPANAMYAGVNARTALPTAATAGNLTGLSSDKFGRVMTIPGTLRDLVGTQTTTISASTSETTIVTAAASTFNDITLITVANTSATAVRVDFRDTTAGSVLFPLYVPAGDTRGFSVQRPIPQTTVNTNWTAQCSASVTDVRIYVEFDKNA